jgi:AcrR family transcriptional regulator
VTSSTETKTEPRLQRADARRNRESVLESARKQFAAHGLDAQVDEVARGAGVGVGTVYRHFPTKEDLLEALAQARFEGLAEHCRQACEAEDGWQGFVEFMTYSARVMAEDRLLSEAMDQHPGICGKASESVGLIELVGELVDHAKATGELRADAEPWDVPGLICGIGRAVRSAPGSPALSWERHLEIILAGLHS